MARKRGPAPKPNGVTACGDVVVITLTKGQSALVDVTDYPLLAAHRWMATQTVEGTWYAKATIRLPDGRRTSLMMHRAILGLGAGDNIQVDHIDGNGLNNVRANLRRATATQNARNRRKHKPGQSRFKGVSWHPAGWWKASIYAGQVIYLGMYRDEADAARAYNEAAIEHHGEFACLNVID